LSGVNPPPTKDSGRAIHIRLLERAFARNEDRIKPAGANRRERVDRPREVRVPVVGIDKDARDPGRAIADSGNETATGMSKRRFVPPAADQEYRSSRQFIASTRSN
jgi:hypothetical protein